jgi:hypothetical protein
VTWHQAQLPKRFNIEAPRFLCHGLHAPLHGGVQPRGRDRDVGGGVGVTDRDCGVNLAPGLRVQQQQFAVRVVLDRLLYRLKV